MKIKFIWETIWKKFNFKTTTWVNISLNIQYPCWETVAIQFASDQLLKRMGLSSIHTLVILAVVRFKMEFKPRIPQYATSNSCIFTWHKTVSALIRLSELKSEILKGLHIFALKRGGNISFSASFKIATCVHIVFIWQKRPFPEYLKNWQTSTLPISPYNVFVSDLFARGNAVFFFVLRENRKKLFSRAFVSTYVIDVICCFGWPQIVSFFVLRQK